jgi:hypothetical protein
LSDSADKSVLQQIVGWVTDAAKWVTEQLAEEETRNSVYADLGLAPPAGGTQFPDMTEHFDSIDAYRKKDKVDAEALKAAVEDLQAIRQGIRDFVNASQSGGFADATFDSLIRLLTTNYLRLRLPIVYWAAQPLALAGDALSIGAIPPEAGTGAISFFKDPIEHVKRLYPSLDTEDQARRLSHAILAPLGIAFVALQKKIAPHRDINLLYGWEPDVNSTTPVGDRISNRTLSFSFSKVLETDFPTIEGTLLGTVALVPKEHGGPSVFVSLGGAVALESVEHDDYRLGLGQRTGGCLGGIHDRPGSGFVRPALQA